MSERARFRALKKSAGPRILLETPGRFTTNIPALLFYSSNILHKGDVVLSMDRSGPKEETSLFKTGWGWFPFFQHFSVAE